MNNTKWQVSEKGGKLFNNAIEASINYARSILRGDKLPDNRDLAYNELLDYMAALEEKIELLEIKLNDEIEDDD
jgi:hypothetical protein